MVIINASITTVLAQAENGTANPIVQLVPFLLIGLVFYFLIIRPQRRRQQQQQQLLKKLNLGDEVVTIGGFHGEIVGLSDDTIELEIASGVIVTIARNAISKTITEQVVLDDEGFDYDFNDDVEVDPLDGDTDPDKR